MNRKDLILHFTRLFGIEKIDWAKEGFQIKRLLQKYTSDEILLALNYWHDKGESIYTLGFLVSKKFKNMEEPLSLHKAEIYMEGEETSGERNRKRLEQNNKAISREKSYFHMFEESE